MTPADRDVLTSLPRARPTRRSAKRQDAGAPATVKAAAGKGRAPADAAAKGRSKPPAKPAAKRPRAAAAAQAPVPKRAVPPAGWATAAPQEGEHPGGTGALIGTAVQAVGELAQIGLAYGSHALRGLLSRLPRP